MIEDVSPTRTELLALQKKRKLALKGQKLLKSKQDALIISFFKKVAELQKLQQEMSNSLASAFQSLRIAQAIDGYANVKSASFHCEPNIDISVSGANIMGVKVPKLEVRETNAPLFSGSYAVVDSQKSFRLILMRVVKLAELENTIQKMAEEIKKTKRRLNSLEQRKIPELTAAIAYVRTSLGEMERESFFRSKLIKGRLDAQG